MKTKRLLFAFAIAGILSINSCRKDDHSGYQPKGTYGNADITSSTTVTLNNWSSLYDDGYDWEYSSVVNWAGITSAVASNGIVMVYMTDGTDWWALPATLSGTGYSETFNFAFHTGVVTIDNAGYDDAGSNGASAYNGIVVRIVAITQAARKANPNLDLKDYKAVAKAFNLKV